MKKNGGYIYKELADKNIAVSNLVKFLGWDELEAYNIVNSPSPVDVVSKSKADVYKMLNLEIEEYMVENFPEQWTRIL